ncbi:unnamed protein product, partial [marine sediment metagenome]
MAISVSPITASGTPALRAIPTPPSTVKCAPTNKPTNPAVATSKLTGTLQL